MTISPTRTREFNINEIVRLAWRAAGIVNTDVEPTPGEYALGRDLLELALDNLVTEGLFARSAVWHNLSLVAGTHIYDLPVDIIDVVGVAARIEPGVTDVTQAPAETQVHPVDRHGYQVLGAKEAQGLPTIYYLHRASSPLQVYLWPVPSQGGTVRFQAHRLTADANVGLATVDLERHWVRCLVWALAAEIASASTLPPATIMRLEAKAQDLLRKCKAFAHQHVSTQMQFGHRTAWSR